MTLIIDVPVDKPRMHLLAIGVGGYRHLPGGAEAVDHDTLGLRQLTAPPISARAVVDFFLTEVNHPTAALGTVELLLSPSQTWSGPDGEESIELPTMVNVKTAFERWYARCNDDRDGVAVLYFCGHGVERESTFLLLEDFGRSNLSLLENAIDIQATYAGLAACANRNQFVFVDTCREVPHQLLERLNGRAATLIDRSPLQDERVGGVMYATSGGHKAYGARGGMTRFTDALLRAWGGLGSRPTGTTWVVDFGSLQTATNALMLKDAGGVGQTVQALIAGTAILHECAEPPSVPLQIACLPREALDIAGRRATVSSFDSVSPVELISDDTGWQGLVPADTYRLDIGFPDSADSASPYRAASRRVTAWPPYSLAEVTVTP